MRAREAHLIYFYKFKSYFINDIIAEWLMRGTVNAFFEGSIPSNVLVRLLYLCARAAQYNFLN